MGQEECGYMRIVEGRSGAPGWGLAVIATLFDCVVAYLADGMKRGEDVRVGVRLVEAASSTPP